jgi:hypothetical protein
VCVEREGGRTSDAQMPEACCGQAVGAWLHRLSPTHTVLHVTHASTHTHTHAHTHRRREEAAAGGARGRRVARHHRQRDARILHRPHVAVLLQARVRVHVRVRVRACCVAHSSLAGARLGASQLLGFRHSTSAGPARLTLPCSPLLARTHTHAHTHTHTRTHTHTHARTRTHAHTHAPRAPSGLASTPSACASGSTCSTRWGAREAGSGAAERGAVCCGGRASGRALSAGHNLAHTHACLAHSTHCAAKHPQCARAHTHTHTTHNTPHHTPPCTPPARCADGALRRGLLGRRGGDELRLGGVRWPRRPQRVRPARTHDRQQGARARACVCVGAQVAWCHCARRAARTVLRAARLARTTRAHASGACNHRTHTSRFTRHTSRVTRTRARCHATMHTADGADGAREVCRAAGGGAAGGGAAQEGARPGASARGAASGVGVSCVCVCVCVRVCVSVCVCVCVCVGGGGCAAARHHRARARGGPSSHVACGCLNTRCPARLQVQC